MEQQILFSLNSIVKSDSFPFENLPFDIQKEITRYFDIRTLSFFASTSKKHLMNMLPLLREYQKKLSALTIGSFSRSTYYYQAQRLFVCGCNDYGQLGLGDTQKRDSFTEVKNISGNILQIAAGQKHVFVLTDEGLWACGDNSFGQLGLGDYQHRSLLTKVENISGKILQVNAGCSCTLVLSDQCLWVCGHTTLVDNSNDRNKFTKVKNISGKILQVATSGSHTLVLTDDGLWACGNNIAGQLGLECNIWQGANREYPLTKVKNIPGKILQIVVGSEHTLVLTNQKLFVCGSNYCGQLGLGIWPNQNCYKLKEVRNIPGKILQVAAGREYTLILTTEGIWVCGNNSYGQLGLGDSHHRFLFTKVENIPGKILQVSAGDTHIIVLTTQGLWACGDNFHGQLGLSAYSHDTLTYFHLTRLENLPLEAIQEEYHYMLPEAIRKMHSYISKLEDIAHPITKPQSVNSVEKENNFRQSKGCRIM